MDATQEGSAPIFEPIISEEEGDGSDVGLKPGSSGFVCRSEGTFPDPHHCKSFIVCEKQGRKKFKATTFVSERLITST